jgi:hypothetical protein
MRQRLRTMKFWAGLFASALVAVALAAGEAAHGRFSQTLSVAELTEAGLQRLSSDQVAVLDALVRRDLVMQANPRRGDPTPAPRLSQRLTEDERRNAGFSLLTDAEVTRLDTLADRNASVILARTLLAPPVFIAPGAPVRPDGTKTAPEIHGTISLSYGWGKGGYSEKTGAMLLRYEDPTHGFSLNAGYSETQTKSPFPYRDVTGIPPVLTPSP